MTERLDQTVREGGFSVMTPQEMHLAILHELGWTQTEKGWWLNPDDTNGGQAEPPQLDLELMHEAERAAFKTPIERHQYAERLQKVASRSRQVAEDHTVDSMETWAIFATASERAESWLRTKGLYR